MASSSNAKPVSASTCEMTEIVMPNDTNGLGNLMGGRLLHLMDECAAISAQRHANESCVTAAVDNVEFQSAIQEGEIVVVESRVNRAFRSSMEVELNVWAEDTRAETRRKSNRAFYTFVAIDEHESPVDIPAITPETDAERERHEAAAKRRDIRLVLAGRKAVADAAHLEEGMLAALHSTADVDA